MRERENSRSVDANEESTSDDRSDPLGQPAAKRSTWQGSVADPGPSNREGTGALDNGVLGRTVNTEAPSERAAETEVVRAQKPLKFPPFLNQAFLQHKSISS